MVILEKYYPLDADNVLVSELLADAATSSSERSTDEEFGEYKVRSNIFRIYEENIGALSPLLSDELAEVENNDVEGWFEDAVKEALKANVRNLKYIKAILARWKIEGRKDNRKKTDEAPHGVRITT
jgi:DnaD/phage-associated family protein